MLKNIRIQRTGCFYLSWDEYKSNHRYIDNNLGGTLLIPPWNLFLIVVLFQARLSTEREVVLDNVDFTTTGQYRCEVSGDAPMFQTASTEGILYVVGEYLSLRNGCLCVRVKPRISTCNLIPNWEGTERKLRAKTIFAINNVT